MSKVELAVAQGKGEKADGDDSDSDFDFDSVEGHVKYEYSELFERIQTAMKLTSVNDEDDENEKILRPESKFISKKTSWENFDLISDQINREK